MESQPIREHQKIENGLLEGISEMELKKRINYTDRIVPSQINLMRYEFNPPNKDGFYSYYRIGAEWLDQAQEYPLVVIPKYKNMDFVEMFMTCLQTCESTDDFVSIYNIDFEAKPICSQTLSTILSPLLIVQYIITIQRIVDRGLRKGYVDRNENLKKVKGRIDIRKNEYANISRGHHELVYCKYNEYSEDTLENRLLKRALLIVERMLPVLETHKSYGMINAICNKCLNAFHNVQDSFEANTVPIKSNKLYKEYVDAIRFARMVINHEDFITSSNSNIKENVPVFCIDMALLFEHYVLAKLREQFGHGAIEYQVKSNNKQFIADFIVNTGKTKLIADAKYIAINKDGGKSQYAYPEYIKQLSAYARCKTYLQKLGYDKNKEDALPIIPCALIYPSIDFCNHSMMRIENENKVEDVVKFYTWYVPIPMK